MVQIPSMQELLEAGVHFGHQARRWHPKMAPFIFGSKDGVHIIDLEKTVEKLSDACKFLRELTKSGGKILFVGTKRQAQGIISEEAKRAQMPYITERWVGGLITNFSEIHKNVEKLKDLEGKRSVDEFANLTKKEKLLIDREIAKLERLYGGIRDLNSVPTALFVVDVKREETTCREAKRKGVPVVAICDTNANLDLVDFPIPGNDDAVKSIRILVKTVADAIVEGNKGIGETGEIGSVAESQENGDKEAQKKTKHKIKTRKEVKNKPGRKKTAVKKSAAEKGVKK